MPRTVHPPEWPDKVMFAAMLLVIAGALGVVFALLRLAGLKIDESVSDILYMTGPGASLALSLATVLLGVYGIRHQAAVWLWLAVATGVLSIGMLGLVPLLSLVAAGFLLRSRAEGEETKHDDQKVHASLWPDKALAASLLLFVAGTVSLLQALLVFRDDLLLPAALRDASTLIAGVGLVGGLWSFYASLEVYRLRRPWTGYVAVALHLVSLAFVLIGPALAVAALALLQKARGENEFEDAPAPA